jgi:urea transport system substrate-binding protein
MLVGQFLRSRYKVIRILGSGGFGDTYLAEDWDLPDHPSCVVKHLRPKFLQPELLPIARRLFLREAQILHRLGADHPQIPRLLAHFEEAGEFYLVQEFVDGHNLSQELQPGQPWTENAVLMLLQEILEILAVVHQHRAIHRDIKPENIMRRRQDGKLVLIDFGAVKEISTLTTTPQGQTRATIAIGTQGYMPHEQAGGNPLLCSDVHAVGMLGIQALTGIYPAEFPRDPATLEVVWRDRAQVSDWFAAVLSKMVQYSIKDRYQSAAEALEALRPPAPEPPTSPTKNWSRRRIIRVASLTAAASGLAIFAQRFNDWRRIFAMPNVDSQPAATSGSPTVEPARTPSATPAAAGEPIKVGILHSLSGSLAIIESSVADATLLAIEQINQAGGVLGRLLEPIVEDAQTDWVTYAEKARKLIQQDQVAVVFGGWTSASRKAMLPLFEQTNQLLFFPNRYEGQECSQNIFYTGALPNQQIETSVNWLLDNLGNEIYLIGSDYVFPRTVNTIIKAQVAARGGTIAGEDYLPLGNTDVSAIITKIRAALPNGGVIYNSFNGDSNIALFRQLQQTSLNPDRFPVLSVDITEEEVRAIGVDLLQGHYAAQSYFMTIDSPVNERFVSSFQAKYGNQRLLVDSMATAFAGVNLWKQAVEQANSIDPTSVRQAMYGQQFEAPEGSVTMTTNHHLTKTIRIGQVRADGLFNLIDASEAIDPQPWNQRIPESERFACDWTRTDVENPARFSL